MSDPLAKITAKSAAEIGKNLPLSEEALALLKEGQTPAQFLDLLEQHALFPDLFRFLAHALPKRETVYWAYVCAKEAAGAQPPANVAGALAAVQKWVLDPSEDNRRGAEAAYQKAELGTAAGCAAAAAFWSGGSLAPKELPAVPPPDDLSAHGVSGALLLASVAPDPEQVAQRYKSFTAHGRAIASGRLKWA